MPFFYIDRWYYLLVIPAMLIALWAQFNVSSTFSRYKKVSSYGLTGAEAARKVLESNGVYNIKIESVRGNLTDHFDPRSNTIRLSSDVFYGDSVASVGVAAHEAGHAVQYAQGYFPIKLRNAIVPITNIGSQLSIPLIIAGAIFDMFNLVKIGIIMFSLVAVFQLITLPVEFNASSRAIRTIRDSNMLSPEGSKGAVKVLSAAALTYVAALLVSVMQLLRLVLLFGGRNRDN